MDQPIRQLLLQKGYNPIGCALLPMPSNYGKHADATSLGSRSLIQDSLRAAGNFAGQLLTGKSRWEQSSALFAGFFHRLARKNFDWWLFRRLFPLTLDRGDCVQCGRCSSLCPAGAITQDAKGYPEIKASLCVSCQHCAAFCPEGAIHSPGVAAAYHSVEYSRLSAALKK
jgi:ferredoxin